MLSENSEMGAWRGKKVMRLHLTRAFKQVRRIQEPSLIQGLKPWFTKPDNVTEVMFKQKCNIQCTSITTQLMLSSLFQFMKRLCHLPSRHLYDHLINLKVRQVAILGQKINCKHRMTVSKSRFHD